MSTSSGKIAELRYTEFLLEEGNEAFYPVGDSTVDVVWRRRPGFRWWSAQVKRAYRKPAMTGPMTVNLTKSDGTRYSARDANYLVAVDVETGQIWRVPLKKVCAKSRLVIDNRKGEWSAYIIVGPYGT